MIDGIEPLYQVIAEAIVNAIPEDWSTARMDAIFYPRSSTYFGEYERKADGKARGFATTRTAERAFRQMRKMFKEAGKPLWGRACFMLRPNGEFDLQLGYDNCDENGNTIFKEEEELKRHQERFKRLTE